MQICVLGGTAFLGRRVAVTAFDRGHEVTCVARGTAPAPDGVTFVRADRDDDEALAPLRDTAWDAVVEVSRQPGQVRRAVRDLRTRHRVFVSTGNVYAAFDRPEQGEDSTLRAPLAGDVLEEAGAPQDYGAAKVACEDLVRGGGTSATIARSGLIGGDGDQTGRSGYWPWRFAHPVGEQVVVPDDPDFPCALIDVRDLAGWLVDAAEQRLDGTFNVAGPTVPLTEVLAVAAAVTGSTARPLPVDPATLRGLGIGFWMGRASLPLWIDDPHWRYFATMDTTRARAAGLATRPLAETLHAAWEFEERRGGPRGAGLTDDDERRVLDQVR